MALSLLLIGGLACVRACSRKGDMPGHQYTSQVNANRWEVKRYNKCDFDVPKGTLKAGQEQKVNKTLQLKAEISVAKRKLSEAREAEQQALDAFRKATW